MINLAKINCKKELKKLGPPIIIAAATQEVEAIINACNDSGIKVEAICDNETRKSNSKINDIKIFHTNLLPKIFPKARFIIAYHNIQECIDQLTSLGYEDFYSPLELLREYNTSNHKHNLSESYIKNKISISIKSHESYFDEASVYLRSLDIAITTKCSLKCESCANLIQYYQSAKHTDDKILIALDNLIKNVDGVSEFRITGGEPLLNKNWHVIANSIAKKYQDHKIFIYTNGTIPVKDEILNSFFGKNINFYITDYGKLSKNIDKLENSLKNNNIGYLRKLAGNWVDCSSIRKHNRTPKENSIIFKECCAKQYYTLLSGKLFACPFISNAYELNAIPNNQLDYVDLLKDQDNLKEKIKKLVKMNKFFPACDFCDGRPYDPTTAKVYNGKGLIEAGLQTAKPIEFNKYK